MTKSRLLPWVSEQAAGGNHSPEGIAIKGSRRHWNESLVVLLHKIRTPLPDQVQFGHLISLPAPRLVPRQALCVPHFGSDPPPTFDDVLKRIADLEKAINGARWRDRRIDTI